MADFGELPTRKAADEANFVPVNVNPSVVPEYLPAYRVYAYNTTGRPSPPRTTKDRHHGHHRGPKVDKKRCKDAPWRDTWRCRLTEKWHSDPDSPARTNRRWTPLGFAQASHCATGTPAANRIVQYFFADAASRKAGKPVKFELEYTTFHKDALLPANGTDARAFVYPIPPRHLPRSLEDKGKWTPYKMEDLTVKNWMKLARKLADGGDTKLRERFRTYMTVGVGAEEPKEAGEAGNVFD
jgi:endopolyphosphatase